MLKLTKKVCLNLIIQSIKNYELKNVCKVFKGLCTHNLQNDTYQNDTYQNDKYQHNKTYQKRYLPKRLLQNNTYQQNDTYHNNACIKIPTKTKPTKMLAINK